MNEVYFWVGLILVVVGLVITVVRWFKMPSDKQLENIKEWLLYATIEAEKELGSGTGQLKLRFVYDQFIARFGLVAKLMPFSVFSQLVSDVLEDMKNTLETNKAIKQFVDKE